MELLLRWSCCCGGAAAAVELLLRWSGRRGFDRRCCRSCFVGGNGGGAVRLAWMWDYTAGLGVILYAVAGLRFKNTKESEIGAEYGKKGIKGSAVLMDFQRDGLSESRLMDLLHGSEYILTFEDKDDDWMLVGDVPWGMFTETCRRPRIMKGSEAIGLAPRAMEKCKNRN